MTLKIDNSFDTIENEENSTVFEVFPSIFKDNRGSFSEVLKSKPNENNPSWFDCTDWIMQINRSKSTPNVIRGCHAQRGRFCQGKLVESVYGKFLDVITDARPNSKTFGVSNVYYLDDETQNKVWVPRGFLHAFITLENENNSQGIFNYYVDNVYNKDSEIGINPETLIPTILNNKAKITTDNIMLNSINKTLESLSSGKCVYSDKDMKGLEYMEFMFSIKKEYENNGNLWYV